MKIQHLALAIVLGLSACSGGSSDPKQLNDDAFKKISAQDFEGAKGDFEASIAALAEDMGNPLYKEAKLGAIQAIAHLDGDRARDEFLAFASSFSGGLTAKDYSYIGGELVGANSAQAGLLVVDAGLTKFEGNAELEGVMKAIREKAKTDPALNNAMGGLGYL